MRRRKPPRGLPSPNGDLRQVYDGCRHVGTIVECGGHWKAVAPGGHEVGRYETAVEASRALFRHDPPLGAAE